MKSSKFTFKVQRDGDIVTCTITFDFPLSRQEIKRFKKIFLEKRDINKEKISRYKRALDKFVSNRRKFANMLHSSEVKYTKLPFKNQSETTFNKTLKESFNDGQWRVYDNFFSQNPRFREIVSKIVVSHLEQEYSVELKEVHNYSLKDDFLLLIRDKKQLIMKIVEKETSLKRELIEKVRGWKPTQVFLPAIFKKCDVVADTYTITITFDTKQLYKNIFNYFFDYYRIAHQLKKRAIMISKDKAYITKAINPFFIIGLNHILDNQKSKIKEYCEKPFTYTKIKEDFLFRFNFEETIKGICTKFNKERDIWRTPLVNPSHIKESILQKAKMVFPLVAILIVILVATSLFFNIPTITVAKYDSVKINYTAWESDEDENYNVLNPLIDGVIWVTMIPVTENDSRGLMLGLYNILLGKGVKYDSGLVWLNKCIDENRDGIDDVTGQPALTYGNSTDQYFNTCFMIKVKILDIEKYTLSQSPLDLENNIFLFILGIVGISIAGVLIGILILFYGYRYLQERRIKPKIHPTKFTVFKYGLLLAIESIIALISFNLINAVTPFSEILFSNEYNPFILPVVVVFIVIICVLSIPIYLVIFGYVHRKIQKRRKRFKSKIIRNERFKD
ncbi:MAG: hypothetical protein ACFFG0_41315 [Candidatus Thorarchaeota archaeon]